MSRFKSWRRKWDGSWWDFIVIYLIPGLVFRTWMNWIYRPLKTGTLPWAKSSCDTCPMCQEIAWREHNEHNS